MMKKWCNTMVYYRVKKEYDNKPLYSVCRNGGLAIVGYMVENELYTMRETKNI